MAKKKRDKPGPKPDMLKIKGDWQEALKKAVKEKETARKLPG